MIGHLNRINQRVFSGSEWKPARFQISDSGDDVVFKSGIVKRGLGIYSDSFEENGETITDWLITHLWSGDNIIDRLHCFVSEESAKRMCEELWAAGANFTVGRQGVVAQGDVILPITRLHVMQVEAAWAGIPEGTPMLLVHERLGPNRN